VQRSGAAWHQSHAGLLWISGRLIGSCLVAGDGHRCRSRVLPRGRMVAATRCEPAVAVLAIQALSGSDRDVPAARGAGASAPGWRLDRSGLAPVGSALLADRQIPASLPWRAATRIHNISGARRRGLSVAVNYGHRLAAGGDTILPPPRAPSCRRPRPPPIPPPGSTA